MSALAATEADVFSAG